MNEANSKYKYQINMPSKGQEESRYYIDGLYVMKKADESCEEKRPSRICRYIDIKEVLRDSDTGTINLKISFDYKGQFKTIEVPRSILTRNKILALIEYGIDIVDDQARLKNLLQYLFYQESIAPMTNSHSSIGLGEVDGKLIYKLSSAIGYDSKYSGQLDLEPHGTLEGWYDTIRNHVMGWAPLEVALTIGLAAPVASILNSAKALEVQFVHLYGDSSMGKTIASSLAVSPYGSPNPKKKGLVQTWNATDNAVTSTLRGVHGVPIAFDEASIKGNNDFTSMIYTVAGGKEKMRLDREGRMRPQSTWSGIFISNAEHSLMSNSKKNTGLAIRLTELGNVKWTRSAEHADALKRGIMENYGQAGFLMAQKILEIGIEEICERHEEYRSILVQEIKTVDKFSDRIGDKVAIFLLAADIANQALEISFDIEKIKDFFIENVCEKNEERDLGVKAYEYFRGAVTRLHKNFAHDTDVEFGYELWGKISKVNGSIKEIAILQDPFHKLMKEGGFEETTVILNDWRTRGWLNCEKSKFTRKRVIRSCDGESRVYVINSIASSNQAKIKLYRQKG